MNQNGGRCLSSFALMVGLLTFRPTDVKCGIMVTLKMEVTYDSGVVVTWDSEGGLIAQCALLVAVEGAQYVDIFLLPSFGSFLFVNLTEEGNCSFQLTCFDQSEELHKSQSVIVTPCSLSTTLPSTPIQVNRPDSIAHQNNLDAVAGGTFGSIGGVLLVLVICGLCTKRRPGGEGIRAIYRLARLNLVIPIHMFNHGEQ